MSEDHAAVAERMLAQALDAPRQEQRVHALVSAVVHALLSVSEQVNYLTGGGNR